MKRIPLLDEIQQCQICAEHLPNAPKPVVQAHPSAKLLIIGQAPGTKVQASGIPWDDASGKRLRDWLQMTPEQFYNPQNLAITPMGFCYPGKGKTGDLPPRKECAPQWHQALLHALPNIEMVLLIGQYAQQYYLGGHEFGQSNKTLTERVKNWQACPAPFFPLPHPSPRNQIWLKKHEWFNEETIPALRTQIQSTFCDTLS